MSSRTKRPIIVISDDEDEPPSRVSQSTASRARFIDLTNDSDDGDEPTPLRREKGSQSLKATTPLQASSSKRASPQVPRQEKSCSSVSNAPASRQATNRAALLGVDQENSTVSTGSLAQIKHEPLLLHEVEPENNLPPLLSQDEPLLIHEEEAEDNTPSPVSQEEPLTRKLSPNPDFGRKIPVGASVDSLSARRPLSYPEAKLDGTGSRASEIVSQSQPEENETQSTESSSPILLRRPRNRPSQLSASQLDQTSQDHDSRSQPESQPSTNSDSSAAESLDRSVRAFDQELKDKVALASRCFLEDARRLTENAPILFMDDTSPWSTSQGIKTEPNDKNEVRTRIETIATGKTITHKAKPARFTTVVGTTIRDHLPRVPQYTSITVAKRNFLTADDGKLRFVPYFGNTSAKSTFHKSLVKELEEAYKNSDLSTREAELVCQIRGYLDSWLAGLKDPMTLQMLQRYILQDGHSSKEIEKVSNAVLKSLGGYLDDDDFDRAKDFEATFLAVFDVFLEDVVLPESRAGELAEALQSGSPPPQGNSVFSTFADWLCLVCGVAYCQVHGDYEHNDSDSRDDWEDHNNYQPLAVGLTHAFRKHAVKKQDSEEDYMNDQDLDPCTEECYMSNDAEFPYEQWSQAKLGMLKRFASVFTDRATQSCNISAAVDMPCWQVHREIRKQSVDDEDNEMENKLKRGAKDRPIWYNNEKKTLHSNWTEMTNAHMHEEREQASACAHIGPCTQDSCSCFSNNVLCERFCGCSDDCGRRFTGCHCVPDIDGVCCVLDSCICLQMNRECGPECLSCCALDRINPANKYNDELFTTGCQNIVLQRGVHKKLLIGESTLDKAGFGAYIVEPAKKGDYLGDYVGEVITKKESERRGIIYERKHSSFLFDLNREWTIDAARQGNKTRFINHATERKALNCVARIVLANGEHRIKFLADRDIKPGEEILFDYGERFGDKHWSKNLDTVSADSNRKKNGGVLVGKEALDALDGVSPENHATRKRISALRDGRGGRASRGKSRKTAAPKRAGKPVVVEDDSDDPDFGSEEAKRAAREEEEEEAEGDEDHTPRRRGKREIRRPARYTR